MSTRIPGPISATPQQTTVHGFCSTCRHWHPAADRLRSRTGECLQAASSLYMQAADADDGCERWNALDHHKTRADRQHRPPRFPSLHHHLRRRRQRQAC